MKYFACLVAVLLACMTFTACGGDDDEGSSLTWDQIEGYYLEKPTYHYDSKYSTLRYFTAEGLIISQNVLQVVSCNNLYISTGNRFSGFESVKVTGTGTKTYWTYGSNSTYHSIVLSGSKAQLVDDNRYIELTSNGVRYNGKEYYKASYFNSYVSSWLNSMAY